MKRTTRIGIAIILAIILVTLTVSAVSARAVDIFVGRWESMDIPGDGSTNTLQISFAHGISSYRLVWSETYFSLCGGRPGIGRGTGYGEYPATLHTTMTFRCGGGGGGTFNIDFVYDSATDTMSDGSYIWHRLSMPPF
jgi:hypothetical protein